MPFYGPRAIPIGTLSGSGQFFVTGQIRLRGWGFNNTSTSANAEVDVYDGEGSGGVLVAKVTLAANESTREWFSGDGISMEHGVAVVWVSGGVSGSIWIQYEYGDARSDTTIAIGVADVSIPGIAGLG